MLLDVSGTTEKCGINLRTSRLSGRESNPGPPYYEERAVSDSYERTYRSNVIRKLQKCVYKPSSRFRIEPGNSVI